MPDPRPTLLSLVAGFVVMEGWIRLEHPERDGGRMLLLVALAVVPALAPRLWQRLVLLVPVSVLAVKAKPASSNRPCISGWKVGSNGSRNS